MTTLSTVYLYRRSTNYSSLVAVYIVQSFFDDITQWAAKFAPVIKFHIDFVAVDNFS